MYYHVLIETNEKVGKSKTNKQLFEMDREDKEALLEDILIPYLNKTDFQFDGYFLKHSDVVRLMVKTTESSARILAQRENDSMPTGLIMYVSPEDIFGYDRYTTDITKQILIEAQKNTTNKIRKKPLEKIVQDKTKVFIVHGRDNGAKQETARFIEKLGFIPVILHEQANNGQTIIEKLENNTDVGFAIVLYTPCDIGNAKGEEPLLPRARQNVVFEHGYMVAKIGRNKVCALITNGVEKPGDISGVVYITMDDNEGWQLPLAKEMKSAGYDIDFNLVI